MELRGITKTFRLGKTEVQALRGIDLDLSKGEYVVISGPSGSGKTTLLNIIGCMDAPTHGTYSLAGRDVGLADADELADLRREYLGFVFQDFNLIPVLNVYENVEFPLRATGRPIDRSRVLALLDRVGLAGHIRHRPDELSGGQRQRVAVARALVADPAVIVADEPTANLDSKTALSVLGLMRTLNEDLGVTFVFSSHDARVMENAHRLVSIEDGMVVSDVRGDKEVQALCAHL